MPRDLRLCDSMQMRAVCWLAGLVLVGASICNDAHADDDVAEVPDIASYSVAATVPVVDARPSDEKRSHNLSLWATSCDLGIRRLGDDVTNPSRIAILQHDISQAFPHGVGSSPLTATSYKIFYNAAYLAKGEQSAQGLVGAVLTPTCTGKDMSDGGYELAETTTNYPPLVIEAAVTLDGKQYRGRLVHSMPKLFRGVDSWGEPDAAVELLRAIHEANEALIAQLRSAASQSAPGK
jgi:hypothetical protein